MPIPKDLTEEFFPVIKKKENVESIAIPLFDFLALGLLIGLSGFHRSSRLNNLIQSSPSPLSSSLSNLQRPLVRIEDVD